MPDEPVTEKCPLLSGHQRHQFLLDLYGVRLLCEAKPICQSRYMGVHDDADVDVKSIAENDIGRLAAHPSERDEFVHRIRDFATVLFHQRAATRLDVLRLVAKEAGGFDGLFEFCEIGGRKILRAAIALEQFSCDEVDAIVGALGGEDRGDEQLERGVKVELAMRIGIGGLQPGDDLPGSRGAGKDVFWRHVGETARITWSLLILPTSKSRAGGNCARIWKMRNEKTESGGFGDTSGVTWARGSFDKMSLSSGQEPGGEGAHQ